MTLEGDASYLNDVVERWQRCEQLLRTPIGEDYPIVVHLKHVVTSSPVVLNLTDLSGENFHYQFAYRTCEPEYQTEVNSGGGLLLFINADRPHKGLTILDAQDLIDEESESPLTDWKPDCVSEDAQLVDLLQCLQQPPFERRNRRLAVIVSAWDVVNNRDNADAWLKVEMPFLHQFIATNVDTFECRAFGVAAQGGIIRTDNDGKVIDTPERTALLHQTPSERIRCVEEKSTSSDITRPLCWLSGFADA